MSQPPLTHSVAFGQVIAGRYRVERVIGQGGMGMVVAARHLKLDELVAIKFLLPHSLSDGELVARFDREARAAVRIKSEHVARVSDVGTLDNDSPYMIMEYLEGIDLASWLRQHGALPIEQAADFLLQASEAIAEAHSLGIVHRDLKPANLFVIRRPDGALWIKVLDFGISKVSGFGDMVMTRTSALMGSPFYMSPEQMESAKNADCRSDIWSLGVILYELVAGEPPFRAETLAGLALKIQSTRPPPIQSKRADAPVALEAVISRCLEKDRGRRYQSIGEFAAALYGLAPKRSRISVDRISGVLRSADLSASTLAVPPSSDACATAAGAGTRAAWRRTTSAGLGKRKKVVAGAVFGLIAAGALFLFTRKPAPPPESELAASAAAKREMIHAPLPASAGSRLAAAPSTPLVVPLATAKSDSVTKAETALANSLDADRPQAAHQRTTPAPRAPSPRAVPAPTPPRPPRLPQSTASPLDNPAFGQQK